MAKNPDHNLSLVCIDSSENSQVAFEWFLMNIHKEGQKMGFVHVHVPPDLPSFGLFGGGLCAVELYKESLQESIDLSKATVDKYKVMCKQKGIEFKVFLESLDDSVGHTICKIANENKASVIIIGQRGVGAVRRTFFGSVSDYVLYHSNAPVAVIPFEKPDDK